MSVEIKRLGRDNFHEQSLDQFVRHQKVTECWRCENGLWRLLPVVFTEDWDLSRLRMEADALLQAMDAGFITFGAFDGEQLVGFTQLGGVLGSQNQYIELVSFHVSEPYRGQGIGRRLFCAVCEAARDAGAEKLYISAHSSRESQAAYRALGCILTDEPDPVRSAKEPYDVQMEFVLIAEDNR